MQRPTTAASWKKHVSVAPSPHPSSVRVRPSVRPIRGSKERCVLLLRFVPLLARSPAARHDLPIGFPSSFPSSVRRDAQIYRLPSFLPCSLPALLTSIPFVDLRTSVWRRRRRRRRSRRGRGITKHLLLLSDTTVVVVVFCLARRTKDDERRRLFLLLLLLRSSPSFLPSRSEF